MSSGLFAFYSLGVYLAVRSLTTLRCSLFTVSNSLLTMNLLIIGATGGTGKELVRQALELGHSVTAFARRPQRLRIEHPRLRAIKGDVLENKTVAVAMQGQEAVLCALGHRRWVLPSRILSRGTANIIQAMKQYGVRRLICETSLGVGDSVGRLGLYYTLFVIPFVVFFYFRDKGRQERMIRESDLEWTIVRPARLTNGRKRNDHEHGMDVGHYIVTRSIARADVASFMLSQLDNTTYLRKTPALANRWPWDRSRT
ncbi:MAG: SDR family oxidoreductase [Ignavibacteriales bacterium]|nr:SDR family oxidoreductase [Ignavibacteriales bacterium]